MAASEAASRDSEVFQDATMCSLVSPRLTSDGGAVKAAWTVIVRQKEKKRTCQEDEKTSPTDFDHVFLQRRSGSSRLSVCCWQFRFCFFFHVYLHTILNHKLRKLFPEAGWVGTFLLLSHCSQSARKYFCTKQNPGLNQYKQVVLNLNK